METTYGSGYGDQDAGWRPRVLWWLFVAVGFATLIGVGAVLLSRASVEGSALGEAGRPAADPVVADPGAIDPVGDDPVVTAPALECVEAEVPHYVRAVSNSVPVAGDPTTTSPWPVAVQLQSTGSQTTITGAPWFEFTWGSEFVWVGGTDVIGAPPCQTEVCVTPHHLVYPVLADATGVVTWGTLQPGGPPVPFYEVLYGPTNSLDDIIPLGDSLDLECNGGCAEGPGCDPVVCLPHADSVAWYRVLDNRFNGIEIEYQIEGDTFPTNPNDLFWVFESAIIDAQVCELLHP